MKTLFAFFLFAALFLSFGPSPVRADVKYCNQIVGAGDSCANTNPPLKEVIDPDEYFCNPAHFETDSSRCPSYTTPVRDHEEGKCKECADTAAQCPTDVAKVLGGVGCVGKILCDGVTKLPNQCPPTDKPPKDKTTDYKEFFTCNGRWTDNTKKCTIGGIDYVQSEAGKTRCICIFPFVCTALGCIDPKPENFVGWLLSNSIKVAGALAFLLMLLGTTKIITSGGNPEAIGEGKEIITSAVTGLLLIIFAAVILRFIGVDILKI
ncbi:MAG: hypothetical protein Q8N98_04125, partial [bacterium]|nr:hypothetical protein [bacterium]